MCKNLKSYARCRDPPYTHHNFLANCINLKISSRNDSQQLDTTLYASQLKINSCISTCRLVYKYILLKRNQPPPLQTLFNIVPWAQCCGEYSDILCHMYTVVRDTNPMGVQCIYTEDQFFGSMMHVHDI